jgi:hypothetical protein
MYDNNNKYSLPKETAVLETSHITRKVLQSETWNLSGGVQLWSMSRSIRRKKPVIGDDYNDDIIIIIIIIIQGPN